jgi:hypothetical protein
MHYRPGLIDGFLAKARFDLTLRNPRLLKIVRWDTG